jgi:hypothetical protein
MKKSLLLTGAMMLFAAAAFASGVNLTWSSTGCFTEDPHANRAFACNSNTGSNVLTCSFAPANDEPTFVGIESIVDLQADAATVPAWWEFFSGGCRSTALSASADFTAASQVSCVDVFAGLAGGGITAYKTMANFVGVPEVFTPYGGRIKAAFAVANEAPITAGTEYYADKMSISNTKSTGTGSCAGCATGVTIVLNQIRSGETSGDFEILNNAIASQCVTWQTSSISCAAVPVHNKSWGQIKSLYR